MPPCLAMLSTPPSIQWIQLIQWIQYIQMAQLSMRVRHSLDVIQLKMEEEMNYGLSEFQCGVYISVWKTQKIIIFFTEKFRSEISMRNLHLHWGYWFIPRSADNSENHTMRGGREGVHTDAMPEHKDGTDTLWRGGRGLNVILIDIRLFKTVPLYEKCVNI